jgi:tRNA nucleotidyltransferase/poly(A) polymerase
MQTEITLNDVEREIVDTLMAAREHHGMSTTLRCAGGWVRDKLLGRDSKDIDIALDDISGKEFAEKVRSYQEAKVCSTASSPCHASF